MPEPKQPPRPGAGRPRTYPRGFVRRNLSLDRHADELLVEYAASSDLSVSRAASLLLLRALEGVPRGTD